MTDVARLSTLRYGLHTNSATFTGTPSLVPLRITDDGASFLPRQRAVLPRALRSLSGRRYSHIRGVQDVADLTLAMEFRGVNANTGGAVADWEAKMEQGYLLSSLFGADAPATTGVAPTVAAAGHTPGSGILEVVGTTTANGQVIGFSTADGFHVGRIVSGGGTTTLVLDHDYVGIPTTAATVYRGAVYTVDDDLTHHTHVMFSAEGEDWRRDYFGCAPMSMSLNVPNTGMVGFTSVWSPTSFTRVAPADPAHAEPTSGSPVVVDRMRVWMTIDGIGDSQEFIARDVAITYSAGTVPRVSASSTNGKLGGVSSAQPKEFRAEFSIYYSDSSLDGETDNDQLLELQGTNESAGDVSPTRSVSLQIGSEVGACLYAHMPTADVVVTTQHVDGLTVMRVVATGTGALPGILAVL